MAFLCFSSVIIHCSGFMYSQLKIGDTHSLSIEVAVPSVSWIINVVFKNKNLSSVYVFCGLFDESD